MTDSTAPTGILLSRDLFFGSKITGTASQLGGRILTVADPNRVADQFEVGAVKVIFVDLALPGLNLNQLFEQLPSEQRPQVIAFDAHVNTARIQAARSSGCDAVLTRGQLSASLLEILGQFVTERES